jgi:hypothetical protein
MQMCIGDALRGGRSFLRVLRGLCSPCSLSELLGAEGTHCREEQRIAGTLKYPVVLELLGEFQVISLGSLSGDFCQLGLLFVLAFRALLG